MTPPVKSSVKNEATPVGSNESRPVGSRDVALQPGVPHGALYEPLSPLSPPASLVGGEEGSRPVTRPVRARLPHELDPESPGLHPQPTPQAAAVAQPPRCPSLGV